MQREETEVLQIVHVSNLLKTYNILKRSQLLGGVPFCFKTETFPVYHSTQNPLGSYSDLFLELNVKASFWRYNICNSCIEAI